MRVRLVIACAIVALFAGALGVSGASAGPGGSATAPPAFDVTVVNPFDKPVPVTVVGDAISVEAAPIKLDPTANTVKVDSSVAAPVRTAEVKSVVNLHGAIPEGTAFANLQTSDDVDFVVPEGKAYVITNVSAGSQSDSDPGEPLNFYISGYGVWPLPLFRNLGPDYFSYYGSSGVCEIYVDAGQYIGVGIQTIGGAKPGGSATMSGYLVDVAP